jgi:predicted DNA-binding protein
MAAMWRIMAPMRKARINIYLNPQQKTQLEKISEKTGAPVAELVRRAVDLYLKKHKEEA